MIEVRAADLSFDVAEAATFLGAGMGLRLAEQQVAALVERTEGWWPACNWPGWPCAIAKTPRRSWRPSPAATVWWSTT
jgi:hypothetical protein